MDRKRVGLIAGRGTIPVVLAREMRQKGIEIIAIAVFPEVVSGLKKYVDKLFAFSPTQIGKIIDKLKEEGIKELVMIGKVDKGLLFKDLKFDWRTIKILKNIKDRQDTSILMAIVEELFKEGITVLEQTAFLSNLLQPPGILTKRKPSEKEIKDISFGMDIVEKIAELNISQTLVLKNKAILAVEAIEGTTEAIKRGAKITEGAVVVKTSKKNQDARFDIATVGIETIKAMMEGKASCLAIKANRTFLVDKDEVIKMADKAEITVVVME